MRAGRGSTWPVVAVTPCAVAYGCSRMRPYWLAAQCAIPHARERHDSEHRLLNGYDGGQQGVGALCHWGVWVTVGAHGAWGHSHMRRDWRRWYLTVRADLSSRASDTMCCKCGRQRWCVSGARVSGCVRGECAEQCGVRSVCGVVPAAAVAGTVRMQWHD